MTYYRLKVILKYPPFHVEHLFSRESTALMNAPFYSAPADERTCKRLFELECFIHKLRYGRDSELKFRYILEKLDLIPETWVSCFPLFCRSAMQSFYMFDQSPVPAPMTFGR